jgi:hypothetical protein
MSPQLLLSGALATAILALALEPSSPSTAAADGALLLESKAAHLRVELKGGVLSEFVMTGDSINPLQGMGHFLCLDRWGQPSEAEARNGMPFHGEAYKVDWRVTSPPARRSGAVEAEMAADLPLAGLHVRRWLRLSDGSPVATIREEVTNRNKLGRIYNIVQHPTIGAPFLDGDTLVDASARRGFMQSSPLPNPEEPTVRWPRALHQGRQVDLRRLVDDPNPNVVSFEVPGELGWTTATAPRQRRLFGYIWKTAEYPWFNAWRHVVDGKPALRGLEFGTTGLHQPFPVLVSKGRIFNLPLYTHLDAGESVTRTYTMFMIRTPPDFRGVRDVTRQDGRLVVAEGGGARRTIGIEGAPQP